MLLCMSDLIALSAMREALQQGIEIPNQLIVVGFDVINGDFLTVGLRVGLRVGDLVLSYGFVVGLVRVGQTET